MLVIPRNLLVDEKESFFKGAVSPFLSVLNKRPVIVKENLSNNWQLKRRDKFGLTRHKDIPHYTECKNCHQQESKNYTTFCPHASELKVIACVTCTLWKIAWRGSRVIYSNYQTRNMTPSYWSLLGINFRPQPFYKSAEYWTFSYLLVFKSCFEGELQSSELCITRKKIDTGR